MQLPCIHTNGTSREMLVSDLCEASHAIDAAYEALKKCCPNGRDYYPLGPAAMKAAEDEHFDRLRRLDGVKKEIDKLTLAIAEAV